MGDHCGTVKDGWPALPLNSKILMPPFYWPWLAGDMKCRSNLSNGMRRLQVCPSLDQLTVSDAPNDDPGELQLLAAAGIGGPPGGAHHHLVTLGDDVLDGDVHVGKFLQHVAHILLRTRGPGRRS